VAEVARIYAGLSPEERARTGIFANNYGEAEAIGRLGPRYGLPPPLARTRPTSSGDLAALAGTS
jgi:hypothetical protein